MQTSAYSSICVFCGSRTGHEPDHVTAAKELGRSLARSGFRLVYGAGDQGLMGTVAGAALSEGGEVFGVIPAHLKPREGVKTNLTPLVVTETMHERKKIMFMNADAIVTLPGGPGSLDELFEVLTWRQLGLHKKPVFLLNSKGYWDPLITLLKHICDAGFADESFLRFLTVCEDVETLMQNLENA